jgi:hypothetical protein
MALSKKNREYLGFTFDSYVKITKFSVNESGSDESGKLYDMALTLRHFTGPDKSHGFETSEYQLSGIRESQISIKTAYEALKGTKSFSEYLDA